MKISNDLTPQIYDLSKKIYEGELTLSEAKTIVVSDIKMNPNSANDYFFNFKHFLNGERYTRTNNAYTTDYFLSNIYKDYGLPGLTNAIKALRLHIEYYEDLQKITMHSQRKILEEYSKLCIETPDEIEQSEIIKTYKKQNISKEDIARELGALKPSDLVEITINGKTYKRDNKTIAQIKILRDFKCQICSTFILKRDGTPYIEAAHITPKHKKGQEMPDNILLLCPNHHKEFDLGDLVFHSHHNDLVHFTLNGKEYKLQTGTKY
jgi:5-methylcytosine-specific restriction protein A